MENSFGFISRPGKRTAPALSPGHKRALCCGGERTWPWRPGSVHEVCVCVCVCEEQEQQLNPGPRTELMIGEHLQLLSYVF